MNGYVLVINHVRSEWLGLEKITYEENPLVHQARLVKDGEIKLPFEYVCSSVRGGRATVATHGLQVANSGNALKATHGVQHFKRIGSKGGKALKATHGVQHFKRITSVHDDADDTHYHVNLRYKTCTCNMFQEWEIPCKHAIAVCKRRNLDPLVLVGNNWKLEMYSI